MKELKEELAFINETPRIGSIKSKLEFSAKNQKKD